MVDWSYHLGVFLSLSALFVFQPMGFEMFLCLSLGFPLQHKCAESTFYRRRASKQLWSNKCWHAGERTVCVRVCAPVPFNQLTFRSCMRMGNCVVCMFASESVPVGICAYMCLCVYLLLIINACHVWICMHGYDCVCVCVFPHSTGMCGVRKVNIIFKVCLTLLYSLSLSLIYGLLLYI